MFNMTFASNYTTAEKQADIVIPQLKLEPTEEEQNEFDRLTELKLLEDAKTIVSNDAFSLGDSIQTLTIQLEHLRLRL